MIVAIAAISVIPISFADTNTYQLKAEGKTFDITYSLDGKIIAMTADQESTSLLVGVTNVQDSIFVITFPSELLSASNAEFVILVDGLETDYTITYNENNPTITLPLEAGSEEIEIVGTSVIPEFPLGAIAIMGIVSATLVVLSRVKMQFR